jgi:DNA-binding beta-propeller fold protein YncE
MRSVAAVLVAAGLLAGCSERERANPFDPLNPQTGGVPAGFVAVAGSGYIQLRWQVPVGIDLIGYRLARRAAGDTAYRVLSERLAPNSSLFTDFNVANGRRYDYRLSYIFDTGVAPAGAEDFATPGPLRPWVTDSDVAQALQLSADGRHIVLAEQGFVSPGPVAVDPSDGRLWVGDTYTGNLSIFASGTRVNISSLESAIAIAIDPRDHSAWVCDEHLGEVAHFRSTGDRAVPPRIGPFSYPIDVAVDPNDGTVWVCDNDARQVQVFRSDGVRLRTIDVPRPSRIAVHPVTQDAWVTSFESGVVLRLSVDGVESETFPGFRGPIAIAIDGPRQRVWVADALAGQVVALHESGTVQHVISGQLEVRDIAVDPHTGNAWTVLPRLRRVSVLSPDGAEIAATQGLRSPAAIALDPGR